MKLLELKPDEPGAEERLRQNLRAVLSSQAEADSLTFDILLGSNAEVIVAHRKFLGAEWVVWAKWFEVQPRIRTGSVYLHFSTENDCGAERHGFSIPLLIGSRPGWWEQVRQLMAEEDWEDWPV